MIRLVQRTHAIVDLHRLVCNLWECSMRLSRNRPWVQGNLTAFCLSAAASTFVSLSPPSFPLRLDFDRNRPTLLFHGKPLTTA